MKHQILTVTILIFIGLVATIVTCIRMSKKETNTERLKREVFGEMINLK